MTNGIGGSIGAGVTGVWDWINKPFTQAMAPIDVFLLVGVVIIAAVIWNLVLYHVRIAAEAI